MDQLKPHWSERSIGAFVHRIAFDFITQIQKRLEERRISKKDFARIVRVSPSRVSQVFNAPGNLTLANAAEYARAAGLKVALVAYDDGDPRNLNGPISSEIFEQCWKLQGEPIDFFQLADTAGSEARRVSLFHDATASTGEPWRTLPISSQLLLTSAATNIR